MINGIREKFSQNRFEFSKHAADRMILRHIAVSEIREGIRNGEVIEDYPQDKYGPSCLILGLTRQNRPLHVQCSYPVRPLVKVITVYEPDPHEWIGFKVRVT
ncbi:MAG: DUF4258 domain-containing protein [Anaerolineae bacterium]|nr:DUF4258 domain-containing protein [Anaerolineae bacterium]